MKPGTKQRIVGTVVLLALALIFLPIVFDGEGSYQPPISSRIPETPIISILPEPVQTRPVLLDDIQLDSSDSEPTIVSVPPQEPDSNEPTASSADNAPVNNVSASNVEVSDSLASFTREIPSLSNNGLPQGWSVRLGLFSDAENASKLLNQLLAADYKAYSRDIKIEQGLMTGVFVGPWLERGRVAEYQTKLQEEFSLAGMIVKYTLESL